MSNDTPTSRSPGADERQTVSCSCADWAANIDKVNGPIGFAFLHSGIQWDGKRFEYCPWCGRALVAATPSSPETRR